MAKDLTIHQQIAINLHLSKLLNRPEGAAFTPLVTPAHAWGVMEYMLEHEKEIDAPEEEQACLEGLADELEKRKDWKGLICLAVAVGTGLRLDQVQEPAPPPPVDRSQITLTDGSPVTADHRDLKENGQQKGYVVLSDEERAKGFVRPVRDTYVHNLCGRPTTMGRALAETYARDPEFYSGTFCCACQEHFPVAEFKWTDGSVLGS